MASIERRQRKNGISFRIVATCGRTPSGTAKKHTMTYTPPASMSEAKAYKEAERQAVLFEEKLRNGYELDSRQTFQEYADYVLKLKRREGVRESTIERYEEMLRRINPAIGFLKLSDIRPAHLNNLYSDLLKSGSRSDSTCAKAVSKVDIKAEISRQNFTQVALSRKAGVSAETIRQACRQKSIAKQSADKISAALGEKTNKLFTLKYNMAPLSEKTVLEHHRLISTILSQAEKELLVPYNAAAKATPPRYRKKDPNYFQPDTVSDILAAAKSEPLKYNAFIHLLIVTGGRRGELAGLKRENVDLSTGQITIDHGLYYSPKSGVYEGDTKTGEHRSLKIPIEVISLLEKLQQEQDEIRSLVGDYWHETGYVFTKDNGEPVNPQTWTSWLNRFSKRHNLPHINPHAFRHTAASTLIACGTDVVTVSKLLGHSSVTTTETYYAHIIEDTKAKASDTLTEVLLRQRA